MVAGSPVRHESPVQVPIEVQSYQPPWKAFADYAMHHDVDPSAPHFQHLINQVSSHSLVTFSSLQYIHPHPFQFQCKVNSSIPFTVCPL